MVSRRLFWLTETICGPIPLPSTTGAHPAQVVPVAEYALNWQTCTIAISTTHACLAETRLLPASFYGASLRHIPVMLNPTISSGEPIYSTARSRTFCLLQNLP